MKYHLNHNAEQYEEQVKINMYSIYCLSIIYDYIDNIDNGIYIDYLEDQDINLAKIYCKLFEVSEEIYIFL